MRAGGFHGKDRGPKEKAARLWKHAAFSVVPATGIELVTYALRVRCSTN